MSRTFSGGLIANPSITQPTGSTTFTLYLPDDGVLHGRVCIGMGRCAGRDGQRRRADRRPTDLS